MRSQIIAIGIVLAILALSGCMGRGGNLGPYSATFSGMENFKQPEDVGSGWQLTTYTGMKFTEYSSSFSPKNASKEVLHIAVDEYDAPMYQAPDDGRSTLIKRYFSNKYSENEYANKTMENITVDGAPGVWVRAGYVNMPEAKYEAMAYWVDPNVSCYVYVSENKSSASWDMFETAMKTMRITKG